VDAYVLEVEQVAAQLRSFAYRAQGPGLAGGDGIAAAAENQKWTQRNIRVSREISGLVVLRVEGRVLQVGTETCAGECRWCWGVAF